MAVKKKGEDKIFRQYPLQNNMTQNKKHIIVDLLHKYRKISAIIQNDIIKEFQKTGYINKFISYKDLSSYETIYRILPKSRYIQMALTQVIEMLLSRESNIQNSITIFIEKLDSEKYTQDVKHMLHILNNQSRTKLAKSKMVFGHTQGINQHLDVINTHKVKNTLHKSIVPYHKELTQINDNCNKGYITCHEQQEDIELLTERYQNIQRQDIKKIKFISYNDKNYVIKNIDNKKQSVMIPDSIYKLYKQIYRHITKKWKYPSTKNIAMRIDSRCITLEKPENAFQSGKILYWMKLKLIESIGQQGNKQFDINIPLLKNDYFLSKKGILANAIFIGLTPYGELFIRIMKNMTDSIKVNKQKYQNVVNKYYQKNKTLALDFGLRVMFTDQYGHQYGQNWFDIVREYDAKIQHRIKLLKQDEHNPQLSQDTIYVNLVNTVRNYIKNEVNRVFNHIIKTRSPDKIILENIRFVNPDLSKSMNRLIQNCGRKVISSKLESIREEYGIDIEYVNPAYTSQTCSCCCVVHKESRKGDKYECVKCGNKNNADVNAARNIYMRYLINGYNVSLKGKDTVEPCSIVLTMSKKSVLKTLTSRNFRKIFYLIKARFMWSVNARKPMADFA